MSTPQVAIRGNHDRQVLGSLSEMESVDRYAAERLAEIHFSWLQGLTATAWIGNEIFLCHGTPVSDLEYFLENPNGGDSEPATAKQATDRRLSRVPDSMRSQSCPTLTANRGWKTDRQSGQCRNSCAHERSPARPDQREAISPHTRYVLIDRTVDWRVELIQVEYDWKKASQLAAILGYPNWAKVLAGRFTD